MAGEGKKKSRTDIKRRRRVGKTEVEAAGKRELRGEDSNKPVMAILADHLLVPSSTDWFTDIMWPTWLLSSTPKTSLFIGEIKFISAG